MKNLLVFMVVGAIIAFAFVYKPEGGQSMFEKMTSKDGVVGKIQVADDVSQDYANATERRLQAEFGDDY